MRNPAALGPDIESRRDVIEALSSFETRSSASRLRIQSCLAESVANCFCAEKPGHGRLITRAPQASAISRVASEDSESTTRISSAHETDSHAARILFSSLKVMMTAEIFIANCRLPMAKFSDYQAESIYGRNRKSAVGNQKSTKAGW